ncbi:MAG TPA: PorP/SprF family type IX secretion system membrane protein [Bacteroidales bacterium]|nr:PorP/SprF family type IX secretion system membrane protein [Bacteroidales bacterium]HRX98024.1 PorP/SprF family type IX secretion system membrane protein [Bacteroidales bacterium]
MKNSIGVIILFVGLFLGFQVTNGQDIHYSQMYATPLYINPGFTGNQECDYRAAVNYRQQAASFTVPFETYTAWGDTRFYPKFLHQRGWVGVGAHLYYDNAGDGDLKKVQGMLFLNYTQGFNADNSIYGSLGIGLGVTNRSIVAQNLIFNDQWNDQLLQWNLGSTSADLGLIKNSSIFYPDLNVGLVFHQLVDENWMYEVGGSISHITRPEETFFGTNNNRVERKYIGHFTLQRILSEYWLIKPEIYFISQQGVQETIFGANLVYSAIELKLHGGLWHRLGRDVIPMLGVEYNKFTLMFSYDVNVSKQRLASQYQGGFELSLVKKFCVRVSTKRAPCKYLQF